MVGSNKRNRNCCNVIYTVCVTLVGIFILSLEFILSGDTGENEQKNGTNFTLNFNSIILHISAYDVGIQIKDCNQQCHIKWSTNKWVDDYVYFFRYCFEPDLKIKNESECGQKEKNKNYVVTYKPFHFAITNEFLEDIVVNVKNAFYHININDFRIFL